jgi:hypothetical protein
MPPVSFDNLLKKFDKEYDTEHEDLAWQRRGAFLRAFPIQALPNVKLDDYVIGKQTPTFCTYIEVTTKPWASILGATAFKFGIYFGQERADPRKKYRFREKFGSNASMAFAGVKQALWELVEAGQSLDFEAIDRNPLSQMFKAKILSLYFPDKFLNVCSKEHIRQLAAELECPSVPFVSQQQHMLLEAKLSHPMTKKWSNPKTMTFLYNTFIREANERAHLNKNKNKKLSKRDMEEILKNRKLIGEKSEQYAREWEWERLIGRGIDRPEIIDCRDTPSCGYDFKSREGNNQTRCIEVKTAGRNWIEGGFRFFLSDNQYKVSKQKRNSDDYYIYLVYYGDGGNPNDLEAWKARDLYKISDLCPNGYVVTFERVERDWI